MLTTNTLTDSTWMGVARLPPRQTPNLLDKPKIFPAWGTAIEANATPEFEGYAHAHAHGRNNNNMM